VLAPPDLLKIEPGRLAQKLGHQPDLRADGRSVSDSRTSSGEVIQREVTVFSRVQHDPGVVVTGWNYKNGSGRVPVGQFCYYTARDQNQSSKRVDLAFDGVRQPQIGNDLVPNIEGALSKCRWWRS
jgi:hypothetical protein